MKPEMKTKAIFHSYQYMNCYSKSLNSSYYMNRYVCTDSDLLSEIRPDYVEQVM